MADAAHVGCKRETEAEAEKEGVQDASQCLGVWAMGRAGLPPTGRGRLRVGQVKARISGDQFG